MRIAIGTSNPAKLRQCQVALRRAGLRVRPLAELLEHPPEIPEDGLDAEQNAVRKALSYCELVGIPVLSVDYALVFDGVPAELQPGTNVRRIPGAGGKPSDQVLIEYYSALIRRHGGRLAGRWAVGAAVATPAGRVARTTIEVRRTFVSEPSDERISGYPLASLQLADEGGYISELSRSEEERLWQRILERPLRDLVARAVGQISDQ